MAHNFFANPSYSNNSPRKKIPPQFTLGGDDGGNLPEDDIPEVEKTFQITSAPLDAQHRPIRGFPDLQSLRIGDESGPSSTALTIDSSPAHSPTTLPAKSKLQHQLRSRGTFITFDPKLKLDDGNQANLGTRLPRPLRSAQKSNAESTPAIPMQIPQKNNSIRRHSPFRQYAEQTNPAGGEEEEDLPLQYSFAHSASRTTSKLPLSSLSLVPSNYSSSPHYASSSLRSTPISPTTASPAVSTVSSINLFNRDANFAARRSISQRSLGSLGSFGRRQSTFSNNLRSPSSNLSSPARSFLSGFTSTSQPVKEPDPDDDGQEIHIPNGPVHIIGKQVGYGGFSVVKEATTLARNEKRLVRAVKIVRKNPSGVNSEAQNERIQHNFEREIDIWRFLRHRYILPLISAYVTDFATFCITVLYRSGTLFDFVLARRRRSSQGSTSPSTANTVSRHGLPATTARRYCAQLASAIRYLHEDACVVHRDIKPENILLDLSAGDPDKGRIALCDFGMAAWVTQDARDDQHPDHMYLAKYTCDSPPSPSPPLDQSNSDTSSPQLHPQQQSLPLSNDKPTTIQGSLEYVAPEILALLFKPEPELAATSSKSPPGSKPAKQELTSHAPLTAADVWAFGCVAYVLLTCERPFFHDFAPMLASQIQRGAWDRDLLRDCEGVQGPHGKGAIRTVERCLELKPARRANIRSVVDGLWLADVLADEEQEDEQDEHNNHTYDTFGTHGLGRLDSHTDAASMNFAF